MKATEVLLVVNGLIDATMKVVTWYQSLSDSDAMLKLELEKMRVEMDSAKEKIKALTTLDP